MSNHRIKIEHHKSRHSADWYLFWPVCLIAAFLLLPVTLTFLGEYLENRPKHSDIAPVSIGDAHDLQLAKSSLRAGQMYLFEASASGRRVRFLVQQTQDKTVHVALASCMACYHNRDSHYAKKGQMICGKCKGPMTFESASQQANKNTCALPEIPHRETDHEVTVLTRDAIAQAAKALR